MEYGLLEYEIKNNEIAITGCAYNAVDVQIPKYIENKKVTSIGDNAFYFCEALENIVIPNSVTSIGVGAFFNTAYYNNVANWENNVLYIGNYLISGKYEKYDEETNRKKTIFEVSGNYSVKPGTKVIASMAFKDCIFLKEITIPDGIVNIDYGVFGNCTSLTDITIPNSVIRIGNNAFWDCTSLTNIIIPDSVTNIGMWAFNSCTSLKNITIPDSAIYIGDTTFNGCPSLERIEGRFNNFPPKVDFLNLLDELNKKYCHKN